MHRPSLFALCALTAARAAAQEDPTLKPITVTVTRGVEQSAFDAPASIDVIDASVIRNAQLQVNLSESLQRVPGLVAQNRQNYAQDLQISSRGYGARSTFGVRGLRLYADGIPASGPDGQGQVSHFDLASAARIEVLRGPFSALYGNSSGGVISIFTADGGPQTVADISTASGSDGVRRTGLKLSGAQGKLQYNLSAARFDTDGYRDHSAARRESFNGKLTYKPSDDTRWTFVLNSVDMPDVQDPLGLTRAEMQANPRAATPVAYTFDTRKSVNQLQAGAVLEHRIGGGQSLQVTVYRGERETRQFQAIPALVQTPPTHPGGVIDLGRSYQGLDARWISKSRLMDKPITLTAGIAVDEATEARRGFQNFIGPVLGVQGALRRDERNTVRSFDQYAQAQWAFGEQWSASAGLRHSRVKFASRDNYVVAGNGDDSGAASYGATTPALGLVFHASDSVNLYGAIGRGFETPTLNELSYRPGGAAGLNFGLQSANSRQWELGIKAAIASRWQFNAAYFQARTADEITVASNTGGRSVFQNAGSTKRSGVEASATGRLDGGWSTYLAASWLDARYTGGAFAGNRMPGIPSTHLFAELAWSHRPWGLETAVEFRHTGKIQVDDANSDSAAAYSTVNLRVSLRQQAGRWAISEFIRIDNVTGRRYAGSVIVNEGNRRFFEPAPGRTWLAGVSANYTFKIGPMENLDVMVLRTLRDWRAAGRRALLATVVRTWGSSPRPVGSIMALCEDGSVVGSVSGGCIEDDLIYRYAQGQAMPMGAPAMVKYGVSADEAHRFGLPCGGTLELLLEWDPDAAQLAQLVTALEQGTLMRRSVRLADGAVTLSGAPAPVELLVNDTELVNSFGPEYRMLLIGAGQLTEYLATMAIFIGFAVTVCDPREEYRGAWGVPGAKVLSDMPDDVVAAFRPDRRSCVVALTHDPKLDDLALLEALKSEAFYVGAIGSRRNNEARHQRMIEHFDQTADSLSRLRGPIGIYIGSKTPPEIAVSVMAEILAVKNGVRLPRDMDVAQAKKALG